MPAVLVVHVEVEMLATGLFCNLLCCVKCRCVKNVVCMLIFFITCYVALKHAEFSCVLLGCGKLSKSFGDCDVTSR